MASLIDSDVCKITPRCKRLALCTISPITFKVKRSRACDVCSKSYNNDHLYIILWDHAR